MKKSLIKVGIVSALLMTIPAITSCFGGGSNDKKTDPKVLNVVLYNAGWGDQWLKDTITKWEAKNEGYKVNLTSNYNVKELINKHMASKKNPDDLYINVDNNWKNFAAQGKYAPLDDLMDEVVDGLTVENKVEDEWKSTLKFQDGHVYRLPWTTGMGGIYYNKAMFDANGWKVPTTTSELLTLVQTIKDAEIAVPDDDMKAVKPFTFSGTNTDYFDYAVFEWMMQLSGEEDMRKFFNYESVDLFNPDVEGTPYNNLKKAVGVWHQIFSDPTNFTEGSASNSNHDSQKELYRSEAAMSFNGNWIYNETLEYGPEREDFKLAMMKCPVIDGAKQENIGYAIGSGQYIAVPASSTKQDLAKSFIKEMISNENLTNFTNKSHGFLAFKNTDKSNIDLSNEYVKSYLEVSDATPIKISELSMNKIYLDGIIKTPWISHGNRPFENLLADPSRTVDDAFKTLYLGAKAAFNEFENSK